MKTDIEALRKVEKKALVIIDKTLYCSIIVKNLSKFQKR